jgi:hypothetical protein
MLSARLIISIMIRSSRISVAPSTIVIVAPASSTTHGGYSVDVDPDRRLVRDTGEVQRPLGRREGHSMTVGLRASNRRLGQFGVRYGSTQERGAEQPEALRAVAVTVTCGHPPTALAWLAVGHEVASSAASSVAAVLALIDRSSLTPSRLSAWCQLEWHTPQQKR